MTVFPWSRRFMRLSSSIVVVARMQADRRLVENVDHADQAAADLAGQADPLAFPARQSRCAAVEREVIEAAAQQEPQPAADFLEHSSAINRPVSSRSSDSKKANASAMVSAQTSGRLSDSGLSAGIADVARRDADAASLRRLSRVPAHSVHTTNSMYFSSCRRRMMFLALR